MKPITVLAAGLFTMATAVFLYAVYAHIEQSHPKIERAPCEQRTCPAGLTPVAITGYAPRALGYYKSQMCVCMQAPVEGMEP
jgi:hypothetical protein